MAGLSTGLLVQRNQERRVVLRGRITKELAACSIARVLVLAAEESETAIIIYIDSPGGSLVESLRAISTVKGLSCPVATFCRGEVSGTAAVIAACGSRGLRTAVSNSCFTFYPLDSTKRGRLGAERARLLHALTEILAHATGRPAAEVSGWWRDGAEFNAEQALGNGLIDSISPVPVFRKGG